MQNFQFHNPTKIVFGKGQIKELSNLLPKNKKILVTFGGGSVKKNGVYNQVVEALKGFDFVEFWGIEANPEYKTCMKAVELAKKENIEFILSVGGGSVLDASKFIGLATLYKDGDPWELMDFKVSPKETIPVASVITLPATGSEMNRNLVISRREFQEKKGGGIEITYPVFSIIDPEVTFSLPEKQTINGIVDTYVHVMEQYATYDVNTPLQDGWALSIIKTLIAEAPKVLKNPNDYDARANIFWCATTGLNFMISPGCVGDWSTHQVGHQLTALYGLDHGQTLAIIMPRLWGKLLDDKKEKLAKLAREVFGVKEDNDEKAAKIAISATEKFFNSIGMKTKIADYGIDANEAALKVKERFGKRGVACGEKGKVNAELAYEILMAC